MRHYPRRKPQPLRQRLWHWAMEAWFAVLVTVFVSVIVGAFGYMAYVELDPVVEWW